MLSKTKRVSILSLSQSVGYAVLGLSSLGDSPEEAVLVGAIARSSQLPPAYLAKLFKKLTDAGIVASRRGNRGGVWLNRPADQISLFEVCSVIDGQDWLSGCLLGMTECSDARACPTHFFWKRERCKIEEVLKKITLNEVIAFEKSRTKRSIKRVTRRNKHE